MGIDSLKCFCLTALATPDSIRIAILTLSRQWIGAISLPPLIGVHTGLP